jgi:hypothetical protein
VEEQVRSWEIGEGGGVMVGGEWDGEEQVEMGGRWNRWMEARRVGEEARVVRI